MSRCEKSIITYNTSTLEKIIDSPEEILKNEKLFWEEERSQKLTKKWARNIGYEIPFNEWREKLENWIKIPKEEREDHILMKNARKIIESKEEFLEKALPHICTFLPNEANVDITIHFTAFIPSRAFAQDDIVINVNAAYWKENADNIINTIVHEIFHVGYQWYRNQRNDNPDDTLYRILDNIISEGICTYVAYKALPIFPAPDEKDFKLVEDIDQIEKSFEEVHEIITQIDALDKKDLQQLIFSKGIIGRAYYVVGTYIMMIIDEELGREILKEKLLEGPIPLINSYNEIIKEELKFHFFGKKE